MNLISTKKVCALVGASRTFIELACAAGEFPKPVQLGERKRMWIAAEVDSWLADRIAARAAVAERVSA